MNRSGLHRFSVCALLAGAATQALAQNFILVSGSGVGNASASVTGGGNTASDSISINNFVLPYTENQSRNVPLVGWGGANIILGASGDCQDNQIIVSARTTCVTNVATSGNLTATGTTSGTVTSRINFQVNAEAVLYCVGGASTQLVTQTAANALQGSAVSSATSDLLLFGAGVGIQFHRQTSTTGQNSPSVLSIPAGSIARLLPGVSYHLDVTATSNANVVGSAPSASGYASTTGWFQLRPATCPTTSDPVSITTCPGSSVSFSVAPVGSAPFTFEWQVFQPGTSTWTPLADGVVPGIGLLTGATTPTINIATLAAGMNSLRCVITNSCGSITTNFASLNVCASDFNCDGVVDFFDYLDFVGAFAGNNSSADINGDTVVDFFDYLDFVQVFSTGC